MAQDIDYKAVIADLQQRRNEFNQAVDASIASLELMLRLWGATSKPSATKPPVAVAQPSAVVANPFKNLSLAAAAIKHLQTVGHPQTNQEIAAALDAAGFVHAGSSSFANLVGTALWRVAQGENAPVTRSGRLWALGQWSLRPSA